MSPSGSLPLMQSARFHLDCSARQYSQIVDLSPLYPVGIVAVDWSIAVIGIDKDVAEEAVQIHRRRRPPCAPTHLSTRPLDAVDRATYIASVIHPCIPLSAATERTVLTLLLLHVLVHRNVSTSILAHQR